VAKSLLIAHTESSCGWGGQEIRILEESRSMISRGHRVVIGCPPESVIHRSAERWGVCVESLPIARRSLAGLRAVRAWIDRLRPDVVNTHSSTDSWLCALATRFAPNAPPIVRTRHISAPIGRGPLSWWLYARVPRHVVTTGEVIREELIRRVWVPASKVTSVPTGIDPDRFRPGEPAAMRQELGLPPGDPCIGIVATLRSWKGHSFLLEAFAQLRPQGWRLLIVGDGPQRVNIETMIRDLGLVDCVSMVGQRPDPERWLRACEIVCQPSWANEGVPQTIVQAMMTGVAIVTTTAGAIQEAVSDGKTALVVPPRDPAALAAAITRLMGSAELRTRLGSAARSSAAEHRSLEAMADRMEGLFREVVDRRA
jgi:glycosyltransferase involved in cell wall biosynthesis